MQAQQIIPLWDGEVPGSRPYTTTEKWEPRTNGDTVVHYISAPSLALFLPERTRANRTAVIICPGGGYRFASMIKEGYNVARKFNEYGVAAFVLKYRIPNDSSMDDKKIGPLQDAQRAIQLVRINASKWNVDTGKIGLMGFSAGGHLAASAATHFGESNIANEAGINLRPDFSILIYPVISFRDSIGHMGSRDQLIGKNPPEELFNSFSNELRITAKTPPAFLVHANDDKAVSPLNSIAYYTALNRLNIPAELHIYKSGGHGFGMNNPTTREKWMDRCRHWMETMGLFSTVNIPANK